MPTYGFVGREPDATGLVYLRARYYDPDTGRFTQPDPLGFIDGINRYTYAKNSPVNFVDPWGTTAQGPSGWIDATLNYYSNNSSLIKGLGQGLVGGTVGTALFFLSFGNSADVDITSYIFGAATDQDQVDGRIIGSLFGVGGAISVASKTSLARSLPGPAATIAEEASVVAKGGSNVKSGEFSITDWSGYPAGVPKPSGPVRLIEGAEYDAARKAANRANNQIREAGNLYGQPVDVHEIQPVKFGGSPTDPSNKVILDRTLHRQQVTPWWNQLQKDVGG